MERMNHIDKKDLTKKYINNGYCIGPALFKDNQVIYLRKSLLIQNIMNPVLIKYKDYLHKLT